jgi:inosine-uridine nucleoside N-ribohydrolase
VSALEPKQVVIDCDPGVDDALALLLALASPELLIEAVTAVAGNAAVQATARNALRVIAASGMADPPPVAAGCEQPLRRDLVTAAHVHGDDGLGDVLDSPPEGEPVAVHAVDMILETVSGNPDRITIVALGPLTNIATAILRDPATMTLCREIIAMGGAIRHPGNVTAVAEYNFYADPEAARIVVHSGLPVTLAPLDATMQVRLSRQELERRATASDRPAAGFVQAILGRYFEFQETDDEDVCVLHDPVAVGLAVDESWATIESFAADVETEGRLTAGMLVTDRRERPQGRTATGLVRAATHIEARRFLDLFLDRVLGSAGSGQGSKRGAQDGAGYRAAACGFGALAGQFQGVKRLLKLKHSSHDRPIDPGKPAPRRRQSRFVAAPERLDRPRETL